ncbi:hypothetical protein Bbelb_187830 [Branchiostoma belcheri]|nr:hypothetical protein Bbelb_187830 [Branchiostoma belcheri]
MHTSAPHPYKLSRPPYEYEDEENTSYSKLIWIPGLVGIVGNKLADGLAKDGAPESAIHDSRTYADLTYEKTRHQKEINANNQKMAKKSCWASALFFLGATRVICGREGRFAAEGVFATERSNASNMRPRGTICCRGSFCHGSERRDDLLPREFLPRREGFLSVAKTPSAANRPSRPHITRVAQRKNSADAQQDCEGGYIGPSSDK